MYLGAQVAYALTPLNLLISRVQEHFGTRSFLSFAENRIHLWLLVIKLYQHRPQIAKTNFCVIRGHVHSPKVKLVVTLPPTMAHYNGTLRRHPAMAPRPLHPAVAPCNGTQQWHHVHSTIAHYNGTLQRHPAMAPRPLNHSTLQWHPAMAPSNGTTSTQP